MAMDELRSLITDIKFGDLTENVTKSMCEIIVKGKPTDYKFEPDPELPGYTAKIEGEGSHGMGCEYLENFWLDEMNKQILLRSRLFEEEWKTASDPMDNYVIFRPTQKALQLYDRLKEEGLIDKDGYLNIGPEPHDSGFV